MVLGAVLYDVSHSYIQTATGLLFCIYLIILKRFYWKYIMLYTAHYISFIVVNKVILYANKILFDIRKLYQPRKLLFLSMNWNKGKCE